MNNHKRAKRSVVSGWTPKSARSQKNWFYSVDISGLTGFGLSVTLTVRDCPPSAAEFHRLRKNFLQRLRDSHGLIRGHWLIEWQARGVPHLHGCFYFETPVWPNVIADIWCDIVSDYGAKPVGQHLAPIHDPVGWLKYLAKHGARGIQHYQRQNKNRPREWDKSGRLWGYVGDWPIRDPMRFEVGREGFWQYRRLVNRWCIADARAQGDRRRVAFLKRQYQLSDRNLCEVRGTSDWIPLDAGLRLVVWLGGQGYEIQQTFKD